MTLLETIKDGLRQGRALMPWRTLAILAVIGIYIAGGLYTVRSDETGVVVRFGKPVVAAQPGLGFEPFWPFAEIRKVNVRSSFFMSVGYREMDLINNIPPGPEETEFLTNDTNLINLRIRVYYSIEDPVAFLFRSEKPMFHIRRVAESHLTRIVGSMAVDDALTVGQLSIAQELKAATQETLDAYGLGLSIGQVSILAIEPPSRVKPAFQDVVDAKADKNRMVMDACADVNKLLPQARGQASTLVAKAAGEKERRVSSAYGSAEQAKALQSQFAQAGDKEVFLRRLSMRALKRALPRTDRLVVDHGPGSTRVTILK